MSRGLGWIDASAGVAGDMLLGALVDAGADLAAVQRCVDAVIPGSVSITSTPVTRAGLRATKIDVTPRVSDPPRRRWSDISALLRRADLAEDVRDRALAVFQRLAVAEARVHGVEEAEVHFHEVGALDSLADVVGVSAAVCELALDRLIVSPVALGSGTAGTAHGRLPVPVPAVLELSRGWPVLAGGTGELTTPTGMALVTALCTGGGELPALVVQGVGVGAGSRDLPGRANVTRVVIGQACAPAGPTESMVLLEAGIDDLDPRLWPGVVNRVLAAGAADAWLVPILMKKGRPAHLLSVLVRPDQVDRLRDLVLTATTTLGVRQSTVQRYALPRRWIRVGLAAGTVLVKVAHRDGLVLQATPEFDSVAAYAQQVGRPEAEVLSDAVHAAARLGYRAGAPLPPA